MSGKHTHLDTLSEDELFERFVRHGDRDAFGKLYQRSKPGLLGSVRKAFPNLGTGYESSEDIVQDVFAKLWERPHEYGAPHMDQGGKVFPLLMTIARNKVIDTLRSEKRKTRLNLEKGAATDAENDNEAVILSAETPPSFRHSLDAEEIEKLLRERARLPEKQKDLLRDLLERPDFWKAYTPDHDQIASEYGIAVENARTRFSKLKKAITHAFATRAHLLNTLGTIFSPLRSAVNVVRSAATRMSRYALLMLLALLICWLAAVFPEKNNEASHPNDQSVPSPLSNKSQGDALLTQGNTATGSKADSVAADSQSIAREHSNPVRGIQEPSSGVVKLSGLKLKVKMEGFPYEVVFYHDGIDDARKELLRGSLGLIGHVEFVEVPANSRKGYVFYAAKGGSMSQKYAKEVISLIELGEPGTRSNYVIESLPESASSDVEKIIVQLPSNKPQEK